MSKHLSAQDIEQYRRQTISPAQLLIIDAHIASCDLCREQLDDAPLPDTAFTYLQSAFDSYPSPESHHLSFEQIAAYVDDELDEADRESLEHHLRLCQMCEAEARDLRMFSQVMDHSSDQYLPSAHATYREKLLLFWRSAAPGIAVAAAMAIIVISIAIVVSRREVATLQSQVRELEQVNQRLETELAESRQQNQKILDEYEANKAALAERQTQINGDQPDTDRMMTDEHGAAVMTISDGALEVTLDAKGNLSGLESLPQTWQQEMKAALLNQNVKAPRGLLELKGKPVTLLNGSEVSVSFNLIAPVGKVVESDRPTFRWHALEGASNYTVAVFDSKFNQVATSGPVQSSEWTLPHSLRRGAVYWWQVTALKDGKEIISPRPPAYEAKFKVLEQAAAARLDYARKQYANSNLVLGVLYAQAGLLDQAERNFQALADRNPRSIAAKKLLQSIQALQRR